MSGSKTKQRLPPLLDAPPADAGKDTKPTPVADSPPEKSTVDKTDKNDKTENSSGNSYHIKSQNDFETIVQKATTPVIVDFFATWCDPCKTLTPRLETVIQRMKGKVQLAKVDIDVMTDLALDYRISSVPVLVRMKDGREQGRMVGLQNVAQLEAFIEKQDAKEEDTTSNSEDEKPTNAVHDVTRKDDKPLCEVPAAPAQS